ncbi:DUF1496 domain-containing protein [Pseudoalteromonas citrea]|uniref:DUF1496 domain-containing protein n=2 Tax=Pseudoalteromonas TaxID=53246 RepID=A0A5S3XR66_9GAMM|nr:MULTISPECIES: DUF1496 domain-containing protein [Pseudoalteromonas]RJE72216.1 hypothetical protein BGP78_19565 [Pseudoalteromonas sp. MSK9-3]TMO75737.1 DUF1496 domain-containing protein [Pseudoalteromonas aurantia]TMP42565.1 DUF1496 domain-containing protein [Pseudoalteromonas citrea]TMP59257.1 DUF1496 domain-containing protein [Pseudoalteromonas citrea]
MRNLTLTAFAVMLTAPELLALDTNHEKSVFIDQPMNVCWYQGQQYSEGSLIKQFDMLFACAKKHPRKNSHSLVWVKANASGVPIKLDPERTIRVK